MAQKFGGKYSPGGKGAQTGGNKFANRKPQQSPFRTKLLFIAPLPLLLAALAEMNLDQSGNLFAMLSDFGALALLLLAAWLLKDGLAAEDAYNTRKVSRPPAIPRKLFATLLTGAGVTLAAFGGWKAGLVPSIVYGALAAGAHLLCFGTDPMRKKGMEGFNEFETDRVARAVEKAEGLLRETLTAANRFGDRQLEGRVERLAATVRDMFRVVENDPRDLTSARKFLSVYLIGARDATIKFADIYSRNRDAKARQDYEELLDDLEASFSQQSQKLLLDDRSDLDIEIEVLRDRLKREGLTAQ